MDAHHHAQENINISPSSKSKHVRLSSTASASSDMSYTSDRSSKNTGLPLSYLSPTFSDSASTLSPFTSPPTTPKSPLPSSRLHRFTSHKHLSSFASAASITPDNDSNQHKRARSSISSSLINDDVDDKFTQLPTPSSRERRSSSFTYANHHHSARSRRSLVNLRKPLLLNSNSSTSLLIDEEASNTPKGAANLDVLSVAMEGNKLSRRHIEASRRAAREAIEEDYRALEPGNAKGADFVLDCYFTSLDYLIKGLKSEDTDTPESLKHRKAIRVRLQTLLDSFSTPEEIEEEHTKRYQDIARAIQGLSSSPSTVAPAERCNCALTTMVDYSMLVFNIVASALLSILVYIVDLCTTTPKELSKMKVT